MRVGTEQKVIVPIKGGRRVTWETDSSGESSEEDEPKRKAEKTIFLPKTQQSPPQQHKEKPATPGKDATDRSQNDGNRPLKVVFDIPTVRALERKTVDKEGSKSAFSESESNNLNFSIAQILSHQTDRNEMEMEAQKCLSPRPAQAKRPRISDLPRIPKTAAPKESPAQRVLTQVVQASERKTSKEVKPVQTEAQRRPAVNANPPPAKRPRIADLPTIPKISAPEVFSAPPKSSFLIQAQKTSVITPPKVANQPPSKRVRVSDLPRIPNVVAAEPVPSAPRTTPVVQTPTTAPSTSLAVAEKESTTAKIPSAIGTLDKKKATPGQTHEKTQKLLFALPEAAQHPAERVRVMDLPRIPKIVTSEAVPSPPKPQTLLQTSTTTPKTLIPAAQKRMAPRNTETPTPKKIETRSATALPKTIQTRSTHQCTSKPSSSAMEPTIPKSTPDLTHHLHTINQIVEKTLAHGIPLAMAFIRYAKGTSSRSITHSLKQVFGHPKWNTVGIRVQGAYLNQLHYADNVVLLAANQDSLQAMVEAIYRGSVKNKLKIVLQDSTLMSKQNLKISINGRYFEQVDKLIHFGQEFRLPRNHEFELKRRIAEGWRMFGIFEKTLTSLTVLAKEKKKLFKKKVLPLLVHGSETWALTETAKKKLTNTQEQMVKKMLGRFPSQEEFDDMAKIESALKTATKKKWNYAWNLVNDKAKETPINVTRWQPQGKKPRGRPATKWSDDFIKKVRSDTWENVAKKEEKKQWCSVGTQGI
ncbi:hypothetical protein L596_028767 [Steinernema carpocapsae]|uniref:Reverse transcriptase domain-containing protein n=1 Tax=Steinernema carpocapsae TaxID=34508 RepID=A0A4U5LZD8_STECR|nr:hypothetical protein L596_028767 [Steinernema carpocapsae]